MKKISITVILLFIVIRIYAETKDTIIRGVKIVFNYSPAIYPQSWLVPPINANGVPMKPSEIARSKQSVANALQKYPGALLRKELKAVHFLRSMKFYDIEYGGTNSSDALYLTNDGTDKGYTDLYLEQTFHHEFSSILFRNYVYFFDSSSWRKANLPGFDYNDPENGVGAIRNNQSSQDIDTALCEKGFLTQYSMSGIENDMNTFAQNLFSPSPGFWDIADHYPRINEKLNILISFYNKLDPKFTEQYFRKMDSKN